MVRQKDLEKNIKNIGCSVDLWGFTELTELSKVLTSNEQVASVVNGFYEGGFAMLCVTDHRVLLIDKKPFLLTIEDLRYDMIAEVDYKAHIVTASFDVLTPMRNLRFSSWNRRRLHNAMCYVQQRLLEMRNRQSIMHRALDQSQTGSYAPAPQVAPQLSVVEAQLETNGVDRNNPALVMNPYTKAPILSRRRRYPNLYSPLAR